MKDDYQRNGFAVMERIIPESALASIRSAALRIVDQFDAELHRSVFTTKDHDRGRDAYFIESAEAVHCFLEEDALDSSGKLILPKRLAINKIGHALHDRDPAFRAFCRQSVFAEMLRELGYRSAHLWQTMYIFKQPRIGGEVRWHQDASYLMTSPSSVVGFWVAVEDSDRENGCLWVQPGGHHSPLRDVYEYDHAMKQGQLRHLADHPWPQECETLAVEVPAGSLVIFNDHMPHCSSHNHSEKSRHAFTMHFAASDSIWRQENWLQRPNLGPFLV